VLFLTGLFILNATWINLVPFLGAHSLKRIGENCRQCRHSNAGLWRFQFSSGKVWLLLFFNTFVLQEFRIRNLFLKVMFWLCCSAPHALLAMGKVDPSHPDLAVDPLNILRPHSKLIHQLPLVMYSNTWNSLSNIMYFFQVSHCNCTLSSIFGPDFIFIGCGLLVKYIFRSVLILRLQERLVLDMSSISGEWIAQQTNLYLQMSLEILLALLIIYFTQVSYLATSTHLISSTSYLPFI